MEARKRKFAGCVFSSGSALILAVVLTSMLAIVGILFVMMARVDKIATSAISENRELDLAIETVIAEISQQLVSDTPGIGSAWQEYYDYPDPCNAWLASLEPYQESPGVYKWQQISDVNNQLGLHAWGLPADIIPDYQLPVEIGDSNVLLLFPYPADADGDGASDSVWIKLPDMTGSKGQPIYAAVRVVDNQAMLNVNTGFKFDPAAAEPNRIDGSSPLQINVMGLSWRLGLTSYDLLEETSLLFARANYGLVMDPCDLRAYERDVIWRYGRPNGPYTPFDISDELEMRYRYILDHSDINTRLEGWGGELKNIYMFTTPSVDLDEWFISAYDAGLLDPNYSYRHLATTYNMDRIIDPEGGKMIGINDVDNLIGVPHERYSQIFPLYFLDMNTPVGILYDRLLSSLGPVIVDPNVVAQYAQLAANIIDFCDDDDINNDGVLDAGCVTTLFDPYDPGIIHYGFEAQPFITEIGIILPGTGQFDRSKPPVQIDPDQSSFAVELYNPFDCNIPLRDFVLELFNRRLSDTRIITFDPCDVIYANSCFVISNRPQAFGLALSPNVIVRPELILFAEPDKSKPPVPIGSSDYSYDIFLKRIVSATGPMIYVDKQEVPELDLDQPTSQILYLGRCVSDWHVVYPTLIPDVGTLGIVNNISPTLFPEHNFSFFLPNPLYPRARFITVGDIPRVLTLGHGTTRNSTIGWQLMAFEQLELSTAIDQERNVRLDVQNPLHRNVFQYLTVFDPTSDFIDNDGDGLGTDLNSDGFLDSTEIDLDEVKIPGRININTVPWYVLAQLPWVSKNITEPINYKLAQAIVAYRDKTFIQPAGPDYSGRPGRPGFASIGELNFVSVLPPVPDANYSIGKYMLDPCDLGTEFLTHPGYPDLTTDGWGWGDGVLNDFEERDVIFSRISNLVTVRSDVFTAYILVRIGADGPQKRAIAILDRSGVNKMNFSLPDGKVRIVALQYVPDPR